MKIFFIWLGLLSTLTFFTSFNVNAETDTCTGINIPITNSCDPIVLDTQSFLYLPSKVIQCEFDNLSKRNCNGSYYSLNFMITKDGIPAPALVDKTISFIFSGSIPVQISGLNLERLETAASYFDYFEIVNNSAYKITVENNEISGSGNTNEKNCIVLKGVGPSSIMSSKFYGCNEGVRIEGNNNFLGAADDTKLEEMNDIHV